MYTALKITYFLSFKVTCLVTDVLIYLKHNKNLLFWSFNMLDLYFCNSQTISTKILVQQNLRETIVKLKF